MPRVPLGISPADAVLVRPRGIARRPFRRVDLRPTGKKAGGERVQSVLDVSHGSKTVSVFLFESTLYLRPYRCSIGSKCPRHGLRAPLHMGCTVPEVQARAECLSGLGWPRAAATSRPGARAPEGPPWSWSRSPRSSCRCPAASLHGRRPLSGMQSLAGHFRRFR